MKRPLTRENKEDLMSLLISDFEDELNTVKYKKELESFLEEHFTNAINKIFGEKLLKSFNNVRESIRIESLPRISSKLIDKLIPELSNELRNSSYDQKFGLGELSGDSPDIKFKIASVVYPINTLNLMTEKKCPILNRLEEGKDIFSKNIELEDFIPEDKIDELILLYKEYQKREFIIQNALRAYKYNDIGTTVYNSREFLWNIKTWEDLKDLNLDWYNRLQEYTKIKDSDKKFDISTMTMEEIFDGLDDELGL